MVGSLPGGIFCSPVQALVALTCAVKASSIWSLRATTACCRCRGGNSRSCRVDSCSATTTASATGAVIHQCLIGRLGSCLPFVDLMAGVP